MATDPWDDLRCYTATDSVWLTWSNSNCTSTATSTTATSTWSYWNNTTSTADATSLIWEEWSSQYFHQRAAYTQVRQRTPTEISEQLRREEEARERAREQAERYRAAKERAEGLLYEHLTDAQRAQLKRDRFFVVVGGKSGKQYRIHDHGSFSGNIEEIDAGGRVTARLCAHLESAANAPYYDHLLAQKLMLEHEEEEFIRKANVHFRAA